MSGIRTTPKLPRQAAIEAALRSAVPRHRLLAWEENGYDIDPRNCCEQCRRLYKSFLTRFHKLVDNSPPERHA